MLPLPIRFIDTQNPCLGRRRSIIDTWVANRRVEVVRLLQPEKFARSDEQAWPIQEIFCSEIKFRVTASLHDVGTANRRFVKMGRMA